MRSPSVVCSSFADDEVPGKGRSSPPNGYPPPNYTPSAGHRGELRSQGSLIKALACSHWTFLPFGHRSKKHLSRLAMPPQTGKGHIHVSHHQMPSQPTIQERRDPAMACPRSRSRLRPPACAVGPRKRPGQGVPQQGGGKETNRGACTRKGGLRAALHHPSAPLSNSSGAPWGTLEIELQGSPFGHACMHDFWTTA